MAEGLQQILLRTLEGAAELHVLAEMRQNLGATAPAIEAQLTKVTSKGRFGALQVAVINAEGWLAWSSVPDWRRVWLGDRQHFIVHHSGERRLHVSEPLIGRATGRWSLQLTRPIVDGQTREFAGVAVVSLDAVELSYMMARLHAAPSSVTALLRLTDGAVLALGDERDRAIFGTTLGSDSRLLRMAREGGEARIGSDVLAGPDRLLAIRAIPGAPLAVLFATDADRSLAAVATLRQTILLATTGITLLGLLIAVVAARRWSRGPRG